MNDSTQTPPPLRPGTAKILRNLGYLVLAIFPVFFSCLARRAFAPLDGFIYCIYDEPSAHQLLWWRYSSGAAYIVLAVASVFERRLAITFLILSWLSPAVLFLKFCDWLGHVP